MKKTLWFSLLLIIVCTLLFTACDQSNTPPNNNYPNDDVVCEHNFGDWITEKQANCKEEGLLTRVCTKCSHKEETTVAKTDIHTEVVDQVLEATCTSTGLTEGKHCGVCGTTLVAQNITSMLEHSYSSIVTAPTCTERGYTSYTCGCGDSYISDYVDESGHSFGNWETVKEATTIEEGLQERTCQCGEKETQAIDKKIQGSEGLTYKLNDDGKGYSVTGIGTCTDSEIIIANVYNNLPVTSIGASAFRGRTSIKSIMIPDSITNIGQRAFYECSSLENVIIGSDVTSIGERSFWHCTSLICIKIDSNNKYYKSIDGNLYSKDGKQLIQYAIGKTNSTFDVPNGVTNIANSAFRNCTSLESVTISSGVTNIGSAAFYECSSLVSVNIPEGVTSIGYYAFQDCSSLTSIVIPDSVTGSLYETFHNCTSLTSVTIGNGVTSIDYHAFDNCTSLASISIGNSVTSIGHCVFYKCTSLTNITIPNSVINIDYRAFDSAKNLTSATFESTTDWYIYALSASSGEGGISVSSSDLADPSIAAKHLKSTYYLYEWVRN